MSPEILARKLTLITAYLQDLENIYGNDYTDYLKNHYAIERLIEVLVMADVERVDRKINVILEGMDSQAKQLDELSTDIKAVSLTLDIHQERLAQLEEHNFGKRVRDGDQDYHQ